MTFEMDDDAKKVLTTGAGAATIHANKCTLTEWLSWVLWREHNILETRHTTLWSETVGWKRGPLPDRLEDFLVHELGAYDIRT